MKTILKVSILCLFITTLASSSNGQIKQDSTKYRIETYDDNEYIGEILERTAEKLVIKTEKLGNLTLSLSDIKRISEVSVLKGKDGAYWFDNPQSTRYFWAPNGYNLKKGEGYYQNVWVLFNQAIYGITDNFSAGIGTIPLFLFGSSATPAWITLKYSVPVVKDKINLGGGALMGTVIGGGGFGGILYGISTFGSKDKNINLGLGYGFGGGEIASTPLFTVGGILRTGAKGYLITENYILMADKEIVGFMMFGGRRIIKHFGLDFGLAMPFGTGMDGFYAMPWLGFTVPFGTKNTQK